MNFYLNRHKRKSKDSMPYKTSSSSSSTGSPMDPTIVFNGYENPDAFYIRYKTLERQQQHFNVSLQQDVATQRKYFKHFYECTSY